MADLYVLALFRDEARYLPEWIAHYRRQGATRFFLYDNQSVDGGLPKPRSDVTVTPWVTNHPFRQLQAYEHCLQVVLRDDATWTVVVDVDEYIYHPDGRRIVDVLPGEEERVQGQPIVRVDVPWRMFGWKPHERRPVGGTVANYLWRAPDDSPLHQRDRGGKCIVRPNTTGNWLTPHHVYSRGVAWVDSGLLCNHYWTRSLEEAQRKARKPIAATAPGTTEAAMMQQGYARFFEHDINSVYDDRLAVWTERTAHGA